MRTYFTILACLFTTSAAQANQPKLWICQSGEMAAMERSTLRLEQGEDGKYTLDFERQIPLTSGGEPLPPRKLRVAFGLNCSFGGDTKIVACTSNVLETGERQNGVFTSTRTTYAYIHGQQEAKRTEYVVRASSDVTVVQPAGDPYFDVVGALRLEFDPNECHVE